jgi:serine protease Do
MNTKYARARFGAAILVAFVCGLVFASGFDLTRFSWAQAKVTSRPTAQQVQPLVETENAFEAVADHVKPAVVSISTQRLARPVSRQVQPPRGRNGQRLPPGIEDFFHQFDMPDQADQPMEASGSGFIVSSDGYILTNNHVVADMDKVTVGLLDHRQYPAKVVGRDPTTDVAVIKIDANNLTTVNFGDDAKARVGQWVLAIGNPLQLDFTVTAGIVSAKGRNANGLLGNSGYNITDYIQTDAAINPGNSGGPLVNIRGEVIGINSAIASGTGYYAGYGFAIPITLAREVMNDLIKYGKARRAIVGVSIDEVKPADARAAGLSEIRGAKVGSFSPDDETSPARKAGIEIGDIILGVNGQPVESSTGLQRVIRGFHPGDVVNIEVARFGQRKTIPVKLTEAPTDSTAVAARNTRDDREPVSHEGERTFDKLGVTAQPLPSSEASRLGVPDEYRRGVIVTQIAPSGPGYREFAPNDVIVQVLYPAKRDIKSSADLDAALSSLKKGDVIEFKVFTPRPDGAGATRAISVAIDK